MIFAFRIRVATFFSVVNFVGVSMFVLFVVDCKIICVKCVFELKFVLM